MQELKNIDIKPQVIAAHFGLEYRVMWALKDRYKKNPENTPKWPLYVKAYNFDTRVINEALIKE